jgi:hypothetical protein
VNATIPFASFIYFSNIDNKYVNPFANTVRDAYRYLSEHGQKAIVMYPGDTYGVGAGHDSSEALKKYDALPSIDERPYDPIESKPLSEIVTAYDKLAEQIR